VLKVGVRSEAGPGLRSLEVVDHTVSRVELVVE
jgi:hypothetical protein